MSGKLENEVISSLMGSSATGEPQPSPEPFSQPTSSRGKKLRQTRRLAWGLTFLAPNIAGFLAFTIIPLIFSIAMAFTNWDLKLHNNLPGKDTPVKWLGLDNFTRLLTEPNFWKFLGNTLYLMLGMPFGIAASLISAILLSKDLRGGSGRIWVTIMAGAILVASVAMLTVVGMGMSAMTIVLVGFASLILVGGSLGGNSIYRTLFYIPSFVSGVASILLWKKLYAPETGPINTLMVGPLHQLSQFILATPSSLWMVLGWGLLALMFVTLAWSLRKVIRSWIDGDLGWASMVLTGAMVLIPMVTGIFWLDGAAQWIIAGLTVLVTALILVVTLGGQREFRTDRWDAVGTGMMLGGSVLVVEFVLLGLGVLMWTLPERAALGNVHPPMWLQSVSWAKPAFMVMGFWGAIGSNTMLLYLAALTNVPGELYEAADIDGASRMQKFWNVTWPQLAPTTFFVVVMGTIGGLQSGFETARVMTKGGPAGSTTTLAYFIYTEGFETGRLGYTSAVAWVLFLIVLVVTLFNWKFGNKYVNE